MSVIGPLPKRVVYDLNLGGGFTNSHFHSRWSCPACGDLIDECPDLAGGSIHARARAQRRADAHACQFGWCTIPTAPAGQARKPATPPKAAVGAQDHDAGATVQREPAGSLIGPADENPPRPAPSAIAVLVPAGLRTRSAGWVVAPGDLAQVLERAAELDLRQIWIGRYTANYIGLPDSLGEEPLVHPWLGSALRDGWTATVGSNGRAALGPWNELRREVAGRLIRIELVFPAWDSDGNPFSAALTPGQLLQALDLFSRQLGLRYRWSPGATGLALMRAVHRGRGGIQLPETGTPAPIAVDQRGALDSWASRSMIWEDRLPADGWLHAWDLNGMYLAAASSAELGFGEALHLTRLQMIQGEPGPPFWEDRAGYWRASIRPKRPAAGHIAPPFKVDGRAHWYTAPALAYLAELGYKPRVTEAWVYPERRRWLEPWYERLRDARTALLADESPAGALALGAVKRVYTAALGRLAGSWMQAGDATFRPDWRHVVIDRARINLHRHLMRAAWGPTALDEDLAVWHSSTADPIATAADLGLQVSDQLGKWKHEGTVEAALAAARMAEAGASTSKRLRALLGALEASR